MDNHISIPSMFLIAVLSYLLFLGGSLSFMFEISDKSDLSPFELVFSSASLAVVANTCQIRPSSVG